MFMQQLYALALCCTLIASVDQVRGADGPATRRTIDFDAGWRFALGPQEGAERVGFDDGSWRVVDTPHDWGVEGAFDRDNPAAGEGAFLPTGVGWYRKSFVLPEAAGEQRVFVEFDGVMANSDVWLNGVHLGKRPSGYVGFSYELTEGLRRGDDEPNLLVVRADTSDQVASRWYTGSGVYRHVRLVVVSPLHIQRDGVAITTPAISAEAATIACSVEIVNKAPEDKRFVVRTEVIDPDGTVVATDETASRAPAESETRVAVRVEAPRPLLWDTESPHLYTAVHRVIEGGVAVDETSTRFGIREAEFRSDTGFWLNGRNLKVRGVCLHHDGGAMGAAVPLGVWEHRLERLKDLGVNGVRTAHNPPAPEFLDLCDRLGLLVMDEFFDCWTKGKRPHDYHKHFEQWWRRDLRDTVRRDRNHPSVVLYSVGNEIRDTHDEELAKRVLRGLVDECHDADPTRPVTQALFRPNVTHDYDNGLADLLDVIGTNYRDLELLQAWRDDPTRKIIGTEQSHDRGIWLACRDNRQHAGQFLWVGVDYLGESRRWPVTTFNTGLLDRTGHPHPRGYERQSWWSDRPMVRAFRREAPTEATPTDPGYEIVEWKRRRVLFDDWTPRDAAPHDEKVEVYSNCDEVELLLNGDSLGAKPLAADARPRTWTVPYAAGALLAVARDEGAEVARHELRTAGVASRVALASHRETLEPGWDHVAILEATVVDDAGVVLPREEREVVFRVSGPGELVAVDNGSIVSHESFRGTRRRTHRGRCVAIVRATAERGEIVVAAESEGLTTDSITIPVTAR